MFGSEQTRSAGASDPPAAASHGLRVLIVDDHRTFAELLTIALDAQPDIFCVGHVQEAAQVADEVARLAPDVVLVDVRLKSADGLQVAARLLAAQPDLRVIMLTGSTDAVDIARAAAVGACGYLLKSGALAEVLAAVRTARPGGLFLHPEMVLDLVALDRRASHRALPTSGTPGFTAREQQVLELLGEGLDVAVIARRLGIRTSTCRGYVRNVLAKLDVHSQLEAVVKASARGLIKVRGAAPERPAAGGDHARG